MKSAKLSALVFIVNFMFFKLRRLLLSISIGLTILIVQVALLLLLVKLTHPIIGLPCFVGIVYLLTKYLSYPCIEFCRRFNACNTMEKYY